VASDGRGERRAWRKAGGGRGGDGRGGSVTLRWRESHSRRRVAKSRGCRWSRPRRRRTRWSCTGGPRPPLIPFPSPSLPTPSPFQCSDGGRAEKAATAVRAKKAAASAVVRAAVCT
jgi:hypothetical protein